MPEACLWSHSVGRRSNERCGGGKSRSRKSAASSVLQAPSRLESNPIPLNLKIILFDDRLLYFLLAALDPELTEHFKVLADLENDLPRTPENEAIFAQLLAALAQREGLKALDREAAALMLEDTARSTVHSGKLPLAIERVRDILIEADFCARAAKRSASTSSLTPSIACISPCWFYY